jgi:RNA methyltransferase, TrmH family
MITIRKLKGLPENTRLRKYPRLLRGIEEELRCSGTVDRDYLSQVFSAVAGDPACSDAVRSCAQGCFQSSTEDISLLVRECNTLRHALLSSLGLAPADWDFLSNPLSGTGRQRIVFDIDLYLDGIRSPFNVGSLFRAAESFGVRRVLLSPGTAEPEHPRSLRSSMGTVSQVPWQRCAHTGKIDSSMPLVVMETGGTPLADFDFPKKGILVAGSEELGVSPELLERARSEAAVVSIVTGGLKGSLNISVAAGIVLHAWFTTLLSGAKRVQSVAD